MTTSNSLRGKSTKGIFWSAIERFSLTAVQFVVQIILARLVSPHDYGAIAIVLVFLAVAQIFVDSGLTSALIQNKNRTERDLSTVFFTNLTVALLGYGLLFASAPWIARFYEMPQLQGITRVVSLTLVISALSAVHRTRLVIAVDFKTQTKASFVAVIISAIVGIGMAYRGFGVWALVAQTLVNASFNTLLLWILARWHPRERFCWASFHPMFKFGSKLLLANLLHTFYSNMAPLLIGKFFSPSVLGLYSRAQQFASFPPHVLSDTVSRVAFPVLSTIQDDDKRLRSIYYKYLRFCASLIIPTLLFLIVVSEPTIFLLLGEKWSGAAPLLQILCLGWMLEPIARVNLNLLYVKGRTDLVLRLEVVKKTLAIALLLCALPFGIVALCWSHTLYSFISVALNTYYTGRFIQMTYFAQVRELLPIIVAAVFAALCAFAMMSLFENSWWQLAGALSVGGLVYAILAALLKFDIVTEALLFIQRRRG